MVNRRILIILCLAAIPLTLGFGLLTGASGLGLPDLSTVTGRALLELRLIRVLTGFVVGAALSCSGVALQAVLRNPLAEPYVLGVSSGGALGAALVIAAGLAARTPVALPAGSFLAAGATLTLIGLIAGRAGGYAPNTLILTGVVTGSILSSLLMLLLAFAPSGTIHSITWWLLGNLQTASWALLGCVAILVALAIGILGCETRTLNVLTLGHETAQTLGVRTERTVPLILAAATLAAAAAVAVSGIIGFVGLIVPHALRRLTGADHRRLLPLAVLAGGAFLVLCDALARTLFAPREIPVGVLTALAGGPFFLCLLTRRDAPPAA
ncbi:MAG: iron ABC transporter permease [Kiritimatiellia bacterium]|jgi:iron complex transport system permease protein|nr:iron ABC transporter permease [Kiritimatiellia bacterium]